VPRQGQRPAPAVLYSHFHGGHYHIGKDEVFLDRVSVPPLGPALAEAGFIVLAIDAYSFGERQTQGPAGSREVGADTEMALYKKLLWEGSTLWGMIVRDDLLALNETVLPALLGKIRPEARRLVDLHRHAGRATYIVSAAPQEIVEPLAISLGMTAGIGTKGKVEDGVYTGELDGPFCYGEGKVEAIRELAQWERLDLAQCYAYSDSHSDLPMLSLVGHPVAVNPDGKLERHARAHGWPVVIFSQRTKKVIRRTMVGVGSTAVAAGTFAAGVKVGMHRAKSLIASRRGWLG